MGGVINVGIIGCGWPGEAHARGYAAAGGFRIAAVADLIPDRRAALLREFPGAVEYAHADDLLKDARLDAVSVCLPNNLHAPVVLAALRAGKHVVCERPPALTIGEAARMHAAAGKAQRVLLYAFQRRFGGHEQAARAAVAGGHVGEPYHVRASWTRTRGVPVGTGWYSRKNASGGGAIADVGAAMLDLAWFLLGQPRPVSAFGVAHRRLIGSAAGEATPEVEDAAFALIRFEGGKSIELAASWAINQPPTQNGTACRIHGTLGAIEVYTPQGAVLFRNFRPDGQCSANPLKPPKTVHHSAMMRHFRQCILGKAAPVCGGAEGVLIMRMLHAIYRSAERGRSVGI